MKSWGRQGGGHEAFGEIREADAFVWQQRS